MNTRKMFVLALALAASTLSVACSSDGGGNTPTQPAPNPTPSTLAFQTSPICPECGQTVAVNKEIWFPVSGVNNMGAPAKISLVTSFSDGASFMNADVPTGPFSVMIGVKFTKPTGGPVATFGANMVSGGQRVSAEQKECPITAAHQT